MKKKVIKKKSGQWEITLKGNLDQEKILQILLSDSIQPYLKSSVRPTEQSRPTFSSPSAVKYLPSNLSPKQIEDYKDYSYQCFDKVHIPGVILARRSNQIIVNDTEMKLGNSLFILLLRLIVDLRRGKGGWVNRVNLSTEGIVSDRDNFQIYSHLRTAMALNLLKKDGKKFIESDGAKNYRISTHPDFITYDKKRFLSHPDKRIKLLVKKLPAN